MYSRKPFVCVGVFKMLIYVQKNSGRMQAKKKKKDIVFSLQGKKRVWYSGHFYLFFHFTHVSTFFFQEYVLLFWFKKKKEQKDLRVGQVQGFSELFCLIRRNKNMAKSLFTCTITNWKQKHLQMKHGDSVIVCRDPKVGAFKYIMDWMKAAKIPFQDWEPFQFVGWFLVKIEAVGLGTKAIKK